MTVASRQREKLATRDPAWPGTSLLQDDLDFPIAAPRRSDRTRPSPRTHQLHFGRWCDHIYKALDSGGCSSNKQVSKEHRQRKTCGVCVYVCEPLRFGALRFAPAHSFEACAFSTWGNPKS